MTVDYTKEIKDRNVFLDLLLSSLSFMCVLYLVVTKFKIGRVFMTFVFFMLYMLIFRNMNFSHDPYTLFYIVGSYGAVFILRAVFKLLHSTIHKNDNPQSTNIE